MDKHVSLLVVIFTLILAVVACATPLRVEGDVAAGAELTIAEKSTGATVYGPLQVEADAQVYFDGRYLLLAYTTGKSWAYDLKERRQVEPAAARALLFPEKPATGLSGASPDGS